ncbi:MAG: DUF4278 domain-containing protein [Xenococcus sp. MO_188.B8]|nr:DUF4278 domain-containing protein [Xenococcus sp. MO_188.B8]
MTAIVIRGVKYDYKNTQIDVSRTSELVKFRGQTYELNQPVLDLKERNQEDLVYREVAFCDKKQTRFWGQVYTRKSCHLDLALVSKKQDS